MLIQQRYEPKVKIGVVPSQRYYRSDIFEDCAKIRIPQTMARRIPVQHVHVR
jgi:hypothetical protein